MKLLQETKMFVEDVLCDIINPFNFNFFYSILGLMAEYLSKKAGIDINLFEKYYIKGRDKDTRLVRYFY